MDNNENKPSLKKAPAILTKEYSRDAHPELLQIIQEMITDENEIPIYIKPQDSNTNDNTSFQASLSLVKTLKDAINFRYLVSDAVFLQNVI